MGILNATPDSFSDGGQLDSAETVRRRVQEFVAAGADVLDVGGESTRPGHRAVGEEEELARVLPVLQALRGVDGRIPVSIDTRKASVASAALAAGADFVNDVSGLGDPAMPDVIRRTGCAVVLMRSTPLVGNTVPACRAQIAGLVEKAVAQGIPRHSLLVDPGLGFGDPPGADPAANLELLRNSRAIGQGLPVVVGASRKRFIGTLTGIASPQARAWPSAVAALLAAQGGASVVRVHDVAETVQVLRMAGLRAG